MMPYTIRKSDGTILTTIADGSYDVTTTLSLPGKNLYNFGQIQNENYVYLLENFANTTAPVNQLTGQLWFDKTNKLLKVYNSVWQPLAVLSTNQAYANSTGNLFYDTVNNQLSINNGTGFSIIGPDGIPGYGTTRSVSTTILDQSNTAHPVIEWFVNGEMIAIISNSSFTINTGTPVTGYTSIQKGINLKNYGSTNDTVLVGFSQAALSANQLLGDGGGKVSASISATPSTIVERDSSGNIAVTGISANLLSSTSGLISGAWSLNTSLTPTTTNSVNLGTSGLRWSNVYSQSFVGSSLTAGNVGFTTLTDSAASTIGLFDTDVSLTANANNRLPTQQAVKSYVDSTKAALISQINAIEPTYGFINPVTVYDMTGNGSSFLNSSGGVDPNTPVLNVGWTTYTAAGVGGIPANVKSLILEVHYLAHYLGDGVWPSNYNIAVVLGRNSTTVGNNSTWPWSDTFLLARSVNGDYKYWNQNIGMVQVTVPVRKTAEVVGLTTYPAGSFDYSIPARPQNGGGMEAVAIIIIGYYS
jgi:hypothetical protein